MPGYDDSTLPDAQMLSTTATWLADSYEKGKMLSGILWLESLEKRRIGGSGKKALELFKAVCGDDFLGNVICVKTLGDDPLSQSQSIRADDLRTKYWADLISGGATMDHFDKYDTTQFQGRATAERLQAAQESARGIEAQQALITQFSEERKRFQDLLDQKDNELKRDRQAPSFTGGSTTSLTSQFLKAVNTEQISDLRRLVTAGVDINFKHKEGGTALFAAAWKGYTKSLNFLLQQSDIDTSVQDAGGNTALHYAAWKGQTQAVNLLINEMDSSTINATNSMGDTALHEACLFGQYDVVMALLDADAETGGRDSVGATPLHIAAKLGKRDIARLLLKYGANATAKNSHGRTPRRVAERNKHWETAKLIKTYE